MPYFDALKVYSCGKDCEKRRIACNKQFLLFSQCFLPYKALFFHFKCTLKCRLQTLKSSSTVGKGYRVPQELLPRTALQTTPTRLSQKFNYFLFRPQNFFCWNTPSEKIEGCLGTMHWIHMTLTFDLPIQVSCETFKWHIYARWRKNCKFI